ncbi:hypothetical protein [Maridesulfovibrio zosterae]|uniref:hypothetical protein n=1 Tax=Maridesulfovibrio zosterae TaxID=82171 RepID=UPI0004214507|nr:hypothetical protein [Maridesulfovibrio zosterae]
MLRIPVLFFIILFSATSSSAQEYPSLNNLKRPRYGITEYENKSPSKNINSTKNNAIQMDKINNSRFAGKFKGKVTVHYKDTMITTEATIVISVDTEDRNSHYDHYLLPSNEQYLENIWKLDQYNVFRSITISDNTVYVTDLIKYENGGGNSQIRTLVFTNDYSALTFLKTEFDDSATSQATGQIVGRFIRVD